MLNGIGLNYKEDWYSIMVLLLALLAIYVPFFVYINHYLIIPWIYLSSWLFTLITLVNHNHQHCHTFKYRSLNLLFDILISLVLFFPSCVIYVSHNINHHQYAGGKKDWIGVHVAGIGSGLERLLRYYIVGLWQIRKSQRLPDAPQPPAYITKLLKLERWLVICLMIVLLYFDWAAFVLFVLFPNIVGLQRLFEYNHVLHDNGCDFTKLETCSHNVTSKLGNWFYFNGGFHTAHHLQPRLHWSLLPQLHEQIKDQIPKQYLHYSLVAFYVRYLFSKKDQLD